MRTAMGGSGSLIAALAMSSVMFAAEEAFLPLRLGEVKPQGWLKAQLERDLDSGYHGNIDLLLHDPGSKKLILQPENNDFVTRANNRSSKLDADGLAVPPGPHWWWDAEMIGDWQDSLVRGAFLTGNARARQRAEQFIAALLKSQDEDGYIGIYPKGFRFHFSGPDGELWTQRCALLPMLAYYEFTGREDVLRAVERAVKLTVRQYTTGRNYFDNPGQIGNGVAHGLMYLDVLEWLYRIKGDDEYRRAAIQLYSAYNASKRVANQDARLERLLEPKATLGGHGPDIMGFLRIPLLSYYLTGEPVYKQAWENSVAKAVRGLGVGGSPLSGQKEEIKTEGQTADMPYEYCSTFYLMHSLTWAMQKTGESRYGDLFERALYNAAHGARFADGKALTYYSSDDRLWVRQNPPEGHPNRRYIYTAAFYPSCCHNSGARVYPYTIPSLWMRSRGDAGDGLVATLYGPSRVETKVNDVSVTVTETTSYPFAFDITLEVRPARAVSFPIRLRIPSWSGDPVVKAPGAEIKRDARGYLVVSKRWSAGDTVRLTLKPSVHAVEGPGGTKAVAYGPLVFSLPVPEKAEITGTFPEAEAAGLKGFFSYQYDPADLRATKRELKLDVGQPHLGFRVVSTPAGPYPWDRPTLKLRGTLVGADGKSEGVELLPMGATLLRRTCFLPTKAGRR